MTSGAPGQPGSWHGILAFIAIFTAAVVFLLAAGLGLMQARANERLCWRVRYKPVPTFYQNGHDKVRTGLTEWDYRDEDSEDCLFTQPP